MKPYAIDRFVAEIGSPADALQVVTICEKIEMDSALIGWCNGIREKASKDLPYWDLACALRLLADRMQPQNYLEVGVRLGSSLAMVAASCPTTNISAYDLWISPYAGLENPGPEHVRQQVAKLGFRGAIGFIDGDSRQTVPRTLQENPGQTYELVTVDGDHSNEGAWADLCNLAPVVAPGGYLLFDDLTNPHHTLLEVWERFKAANQGEFEFAENLQDHYGTGVAYRKPK